MDEDPQQAAPQVEQAAPQEAPAPAPPSGISQEQAKKVLKADLANMVKKVASGKTLSSTERALLTGMSDGQTDAPAVAFVPNQVDLAKLCHVTRQTIQRWLKEPGNPGASPNGSYNVVAWREFAKLRGHTFDGGLNQTGLKAKQILLQNRRLEFDLAVDLKRFVLADDVEKWSAQLGLEIKKIVQQIHAIAPSIVGQTVADAEIRLREVEDEILTKLHLLGDRVESLKIDESAAKRV